MTDQATKRSPVFDRCLGGSHRESPARRLKRLPVPGKDERMAEDVNQRFKYPTRHDRVGSCDFQPAGIRQRAPMCAILSAIPDSRRWVG